MKLLQTSIVLICTGMSFGGIITGRGRFKVFVLDSATEQPLEGVKIEGQFNNYSHEWGIAPKDNEVDAITDCNGMATLSGNTEKGEGGYRIYGTSGYYNREWVDVVFNRRSPLRLGMWVPSDIVSTARLDRIINPIPLWVARSKNFNLEEGKMAFTNDGAVASYDLMKNEWLPPFGNGTVEDIRFTCARKDFGSEASYSPYGNSLHLYYRRDVEVVFPGEGNGLIEVFSRKNCGIRLRTAPESGYVSTYHCWENRQKVHWKNANNVKRYNFDDNRCFYIRIRTELDDQGNIKSAIYGKIYRDFWLTEIPDGTGYNGSVGFYYYLNPESNNRNLEWDMKNNLCPNPGWLSSQLGP